MPHECRLVNVFGVWVWLLSVFTSLPFVLFKWHGYAKGAELSEAVAEGKRSECEGASGWGMVRGGVNREQWRRRGTLKSFCYLQRQMQKLLTIENEADAKMGTHSSSNKKRDNNNNGDDNKQKSTKEKQKQQQAD